VVSRCRKTGEFGIVAAGFSSKPTGLPFDRYGQRLAAAPAFKTL
jgi:hypothetical protein